MLLHLRSAVQAGIIALSLATLTAAQEPSLLPPSLEGTVAPYGEAPLPDPHAGGGVTESVAPGSAVGGVVSGAAGSAVEGPFGGYPYSGGWHAGYQHPMYGRPLALVVPPVSHYQTIYSWGVATTQMTPINPQYNGPGNGTPWTEAGQYPYPPYWPWDTRQFGVYYIRGPW